MVDLSRHLTLIKQSIDRRAWDLATERCLECLDVDPANLEIYRLLLEASRRRAKESEKKSMFASMSVPGFTRDPHKVLLAAIKKVAGQPEPKNIAAAGDAARLFYKSGTKSMLEVAIYLYEEMLTSGLFNAEVLWNLANLQYEHFQEKRNATSLDSAIKTMAKLESAMPNHPEATRTLKNWEARKSMERRNQGASGGDYRDQLSNDNSARRADIMNRLIRTPEEAAEVIGYIDEDLKANPKDKGLWKKKGDVLRRVERLAEARTAYLQAQALDEHDFTVTMCLGDVEMDERAHALQTATAAGQDVTALRQEALKADIVEFRKRSERQPTDLSHKFNLGRRLFEAGQIEAAAAEFQRSVSDPRYRQASHKYLGYCFAKKNMLDLAVKNYTSYLSLVEDALSESAKEVRYHRARLYEDLKKVDLAMADYSALVEVDLGYRDAATRLDTLRTQV